jgi:hypothetical protein
MFLTFNHYIIFPDIECWVRKSAGTLAILIQAFVSPFRQMPGQYFGQAMTSSFKIFCDSVFDSHTLYGLDT